MITIANNILPLSYFHVKYYFYFVTEQLKCPIQGDIILEKHPRETPRRGGREAPPSRRDKAIPDEINEIASLPTVARNDGCDRQTNYVLRNN